ncbi:MAG: phosphorothioation-dependent restriction protein DptG [Sphingobacteriales bacterium]|nr:phosphorothioation-dependent restriction protein DptG [Sphingobacteriales bacterium]
MIREFDVEEDLKSYLQTVSTGVVQFFHYEGKKIPLLPFSTRIDDNLEKSLREDFKSFDGCIGYCYREIMKKKLPKELAGVKENTNFKKNLKENILANVSILTKCEDNQKDKLKSIIESVFFRDDNLVKYGKEAQLYMFWNFKEAGLKNIAEFILQIFFDSELKALVKDTEDQKKHVFHSLMDRALPKLDDILPSSNKKEVPYYVLDASVVEKFKKDFKFLHNDKGSFLIESEKLFKFYYFFYVSRAALTFNEFFLSKDHHLYFTLESESVSESRRTNESGWKILESRISKFFSHAITLDLINYIPLIAENKNMGYLELSDFFDNSTKEQQSELVAHALSISETYLKYAPKDVDWLLFDEYFSLKLNGIHLKNEFQILIYKLYNQIDYQFEKSGRKSKRNNYGKWFTGFCKEYILKNRGRNGYTLNLSNETLIFVTKLCVNGQQKMRLKDLWVEFNNRGIYFDDSTQQAIIEIYDKINLIEKKSDSGDAQYIRPIL